jgi:hypothetical protein
VGVLLVLVGVAAAGLFWRAGQEHHAAVEAELAATRAQGELLAQEVAATRRELEAARKERAAAPRNKTEEAGAKGGGAAALVDRPGALAALETDTRRLLQLVQALEKAGQQHSADIRELKKGLTRKDPPSGADPVRQDLDRIGKDLRALQEASVKLTQSQAALELAWKQHELTFRQWQDKGGAKNPPADAKAFQELKALVDRHADAVHKLSKAVGAPSLGLEKRLEALEKQAHQLNAIQAQLVNVEKQLKLLVGKKSP